MPSLHQMRRVLHSKRLQDQRKFDEKWNNEANWIEIFIRFGIWLQTIQMDLCHSNFLVTICYSKRANILFMFCVIYQLWKKRFKNIYKKYFLLYTWPCMSVCLSVQNSLQKKLFNPSMKSYFILHKYANYFNSFQTKWAAKATRWSIVSTILVKGSVHTKMKTSQNLILILNNRTA